MYLKSSAASLSKSIAYMTQRCFNKIFALQRETIRIDFVYVSNSTSFEPD